MARLKSLSIVMTLVLAGALTISLTAQGGPFRGHADLSGFQENPTLSTPARGTIDVDISRDGQSLSYTLTYRGFNTNVRFAHIHLGRPAINGRLETRNGRCGDGETGGGGMGNQAGGWTPREPDTNAPAAEAMSAGIRKRRGRVL